MNTEIIAKQLINFHKSTFDNTFNAMVMFQEQSEKVVNMTLEQATWLPAGGNKVISEWVQAYKNGRNEFKKAVDENFNKVEDFFLDIEAPLKAKTEKKASK